MKRFIAAIVVCTLLFFGVGMASTVWADIRIPGEPYTGPAQRPDEIAPQPEPEPVQEKTPPPPLEPTGNPPVMKKRTCGVFGMADMSVFLLVFGAGFCLRTIARRANTAKDDNA